MAPRDRRRDDDRVLARDAADGDRDALECLLERHAERVVVVCRRVLGGGDEALDAAQNALISVARAIHRYDGRAAFSTWVYRVATNAALDEARRRSRRPRPVELVDDGTLSAVTGPVTPAPEHVADHLTLVDALAALPPEFALAVGLRDLADLGYAQIAAVLDIPAGTVRSRIARGRRALAARLGNPAGLATRPTAGGDDPMTSPMTPA